MLLFHKWPHICIDVTLYYLKPKSAPGLGYLMPFGDNLSQKLQAINLVLGWKHCCFLSLGYRMKHNLVLPLGRKMELDIIFFFYVSWALIPWHIKTTCRILAITCSACVLFTSILNNKYMLTLGGQTFFTWMHLFKFPDKVLFTGLDTKLSGTFSIIKGLTSAMKYIHKNVTGKTAWLEQPCNSQFSLDNWSELNFL